jgi:hypothetical protein
MASQKYNFLYALIITFLIFNVGIFMGYKLETSRVDKINDWTLEAELSILDQKVQSDALDLLNLDCDLMIEKNIEFADSIFEDASKIQNYEDANKMHDEIKTLHKKYDLLRSLFWMNSLKIQERCGSSYHNVVYFYDYDEPTLDQKSKQRFFANLLTEVKINHGDNVMLIPIAGDNGLASVDLLLNKYEISESDLPVILIDEKIKLSDVSSLNEIESYLN